MDHKKRSIIVEGANASGKSTLATKLGQYYGIFTFRAGPKPKDREHSEICMIYQCAWLKKTSCVWDRFTGISNVCNLPALDKSDLIAHAYYVKIAMTNAVVIVCTADNMDQHFKSQGQSHENMRLVVNNQKQIKNNYIKMAYDLPGVIRYDFKIRSFESLIKEIDYAVSIDI